MVSLQVARRGQEHDGESETEAMTAASLPQLCSALVEEDECQLTGYVLSFCFFLQSRGSAKKNLYIAGRQTKPI